MKILGKNTLTPGEEGTIHLLTNETEDLWHAYNLIHVGDFVTTRTVRKVQRVSPTGSVDSERVKLDLTIQILSIDFDIEGESIRLSGKNVQQNRYVKIGAHHTLELVPQQGFKLTKEEWDPISLNRLREACEDRLRAQICAVVMQEGSAHLVIITDSLTLTKAHIHHNIPRKKASTTSHDKAIQVFFQLVYNDMIKYFDFSAAKCVVFASPGFLNEQFYNFVLQQAMSLDHKSILENKAKISLVKTTSGHVRSLLEVFKNETVLSQIKDTKAAKEVQALNEFYKMMREDSDRIAYGKKHVQESNQLRAIEKLLISDNLLRAKKVEDRKYYAALCEEVQLYGGSVYIFSTQHVSGEELSKLTGLVALLRFPVVEPEGEEEEEIEDKEEEETIHEN